MRDPPYHDIKKSTQFSSIYQHGPSPFIDYTLLPGHLDEDEIVRGYFVQDGATAHTALVCTTLLRAVRGQNNFKGYLANTDTRFYL
jgi:hypothetical protein